ncbi:MAG: hypothetical protein D6689_07095 [Deltaproteobacteria bacterium]|nr:MAG: hypothetical protein D6689_07095 [Deltaproteobacteria bacterium]
MRRAPRRRRKVTMWNPWSAVAGVAGRTPEWASGSHASSQGFAAGWRARALAALVAVVAIAGTAGCNTPSIPIPPPDPDRMVFAVDPDAGTATFEYGIQPEYGGAQVYVLNEDRGVGVIDTARADGSVGPTAPFAGTPGDRVRVTFDLGDQLASTCVVLADGVPAGECGP